MARGPTLAEIMYKIFENQAAIEAAIDGLPDNLIKILVHAIAMHKHLAQHGYHSY